MSWMSSIYLRPSHALLLLTCPHSQRELLRARLPTPRHPRALLSLLESLALWQGAGLRTAVFVEQSSSGFEESLFGPLVMEASALVEFELCCGRAERVKRLRGVGDFSQLIAMQRRSR